MTHRPARFLLASLFVAVPLGPTEFTAMAQDDASGQAVVRLAPGSDGQCDVVEKTEVVRVSKAKRPFVTFVVTNGCASDVEFSIDGFRHARRSEAGDPIMEGRGQRRRRVRAGETVATLRLRVRPNATEGEWSYDIRLDDRLVDPKLQIDP